MSVKYSQGGRVVPVLSDISLDVAPGELVLLKGPSGSGKSTVLHVLGMLLPATRGNVTISGVDVGSLSESEKTALRGRDIGFLFQEPFLTSYLTVQENVLLPLLARDLRVSASRGRDVLERLGLLHLADRLPSQLSGGQAQRVALCRAMVNAPRVLLADEPTASLDADSAVQVRGQLRDLADSGVGVLVATHDDRLATAADRTLALTDGRIAESTAHLPVPRSHHVDA